MGIIADYALEEYQPICDLCGIALCYTVNEYEYLKDKIFWDAWTCQNCDPNYLSEYRKFLRNTKNERL
jgi:hypothetical protein